MAQDKSSSGAIQQLAREWTRKKTGARLKVLGKRALRQGGILFLFAVLLLSLGVLALRLFFQQASSHYEGLKEQMTKMMHGVHEPRRDEKHVGVLAALLYRLNDEQAKQREDCEQPYCDSLNLFLRATGRLMEAKGADPKLITATATEARADIERWLKHPIGEDWIREVERVLMDDSDPSLADCFEPVKKSRGEILGPAKCQTTQYTTAIIPAVSMSGGITPRIRNAFQVSRLLDTTLRTLVPHPCSAEDPETAHFVQAYFINPDSMLRIWQCREPTETEFPSTKLWAAAHYFEVFYRTNSRQYISPAYIDFGGFGIIRTKCIPVEPKGKFLGVLCADFTVTLEQVLKSVVSASLMSVEKLQAVTTETGLFNAESIDARLVQMAPDRINTEVTLEGKERTAAIAFGLNAVRQKDSFDTYTRSIVPLSVNSDAAFLVPMRQVRSGFHALLLTPNVRTPQGAAVAGVATLLLLLAAIFVALWGQARARNALESTTIAALLRNLDVGVIVTDHNDNIEGANDAAEETIGLPLPKIGNLRVSATAEKGVQLGGFRDIIEPRVVVAGPDGEPATQAVDYESALPKTRTESFSSTYYARLQDGPNKERWIRVSAASISLPAEQKHVRWPRTFGIVEDVRDVKLSQRLNGIMER